MAQAQAQAHPRPPLGSVSTNITLPSLSGPISTPTTAPAPALPSTSARAVKPLYPIFLGRSNSTKNLTSVDEKLAFASHSHGHGHGHSHQHQLQQHNLVATVGGSAQARVNGSASRSASEAGQSQVIATRDERDDTDRGRVGDAQRKRARRHNAEEHLPGASSQGHFHRRDTSSYETGHDKIFNAHYDDLDLDLGSTSRSSSSSPSTPVSKSASLSDDIDMHTEINVGLDGSITSITTTTTTTSISVAGGVDVTSLTPSRARHTRMASIPDYFPVTASSRCDFSTGTRRMKDEAAAAAAAAAQAAAEAAEAEAQEQARVERAPKVWRRARRRLGAVGAGLGDELTMQHRAKFTGHTLNAVSTYVTRLTSSPSLPPSKILLPSFPSSTPGYRDREFNPALAVAFSSAAKNYTATDALELGARRLLAVGGEDGGIRILDVDKGLGVHPEAEGYWWQAHHNGVFDFQWANNDTQILSASGDQVLRLHDLSSDSPKLLATLHGHTSTIKTAVFLDVSRSHGSGPSSVGGAQHHKVIASGGRDGNINIYDLRCKGSFYDNDDTATGAGVRRSSRNRSARREMGDDNYIVNPVLTLRQPHNWGSTRRHYNDMRSVSRSITSLVALQSMPGVLASGGSFDGVVKLWDIRSCGGGSNSRSTCTPVGTLADPTVLSSNPSIRPRSINALVEQPNNGDLYALCGDSKIHVLRPSAASDPATSASNFGATESILPRTFVHPDLLTRSFYIRMSISPDGQHLACGSCHGGVMLWDTAQRGETGTGKVNGQRLEVPNAWGNTNQSATEVIAVDWGKDLLAASSDDLTTRIWRPNPAAAQWLRDDPVAAKSEWAGLA